MSAGLPVEDDKKNATDKIAKTKTWTCTSFAKERLPLLQANGSFLVRRLSNDLGEKNVQALIVRLCMLAGKLIALENHLVKNPNDPKCSLIPVGNDGTQWQGYVDGPPSSPYAGGRFRFELTLRNDHPFKPPEIRFVTPIVHINIMDTGTVVLAMIRDDWCPVITLDILLISLQSILASPVLEGPANMDLAKLFHTDPREYESLIQIHTCSHALAS